jgi:hypothetical protein
MLARVLTLRFNSLTDGLDDSPLRELIKDKEVLAIRENFFMRHVQHPRAAAERRGGSAGGGAIGQA